MAPKTTLTFAQQLGARIAAARERAGLTKADCAKAAGIDWRRWNEYETGKVEPSAGKLYAIAKALGVSADSLRPRQ